MRVKLDRAAIALRPVDIFARAGSLPSGTATLQVEAGSGPRPRARNAAHCCRRRSRRRCCPATGPRCSSKVITSAMSWQGCVSSVSPLITGTVAFSASSSSRCVIGRADHDRVDIARQHLGRVGDRLAAAELHFGAGQHDRLAAELAHPTSKETRVRVDGLSKIIASTLPSSGRLTSPAFSRDLAARGIVEHERADRSPKRPTGR